MPVSFFFLGSLFKNYLFAVHRDADLAVGLDAGLFKVAFGDEDSVSAVNESIFDVASGVVARCRVEHLLGVVAHLGVPDELRTDTAVAYRNDPGDHVRELPVVGYDDDGDAKLLVDP